MTVQHTEYIVPTTEGGEVERLRERADQASAEAERLRQIARTKQGPYYQVNKSWPPKYGPGVALLMAAIRDYTRLEYGVCFAERGRLAKELGATPDKIKHWSSKIRESGEFFFAIRPGRTTVYALSQEALRVFMEGEGRAKTGLGSGEIAPGVGRERTGSRAKMPHDREQDKENNTERTINNNVVVSHSFNISEKTLLKLETLQSKDWLEKWLPIAEKGFALGKVRKPGAWLVSYAGNSWFDDVPDWYGVDGSAADARHRYAVGQFADFWDS